MNLKNLLSEKKSAILKRWFEVILETYSADTSSFLKRQKNRFANPVGYTISQGVDGLFEELLQGSNSDRISLFLDNIIRIRAIQDLSPSQAIGFIFLLKKVIRKELAKEIREDGLSEELLTLESRIDDLALLSFDIYMKCREKIYELKANEVRNRTFGLLKRANLLYELKEQETDLEDGNIDNLYETR
ncbi:MAG: RsbRD N-terminal domain-containing protein [Nitrospirota bacterium]